MYISIWIIVIAVFVGIYYFNRSKKQNLNIDNMKEQVAEKFSYKLDIQVQPWWFKLYKKASGESSEKKLSKEIEQKEKKTEDIDSNLFGRRYFFTEYYDSSSGLTTRFQRVFFPSGKQAFYSVDEFGDGGYFFDCDSSLKASLSESDEARAQRDKLSIDIGDSFIRNNIFDKYVGGARADFDYKKEDYLFKFPLHQIFNFLFALGQRFHGTEANAIIKWPDVIEKKFEEFGIKYEIHFDNEPTSFKIEEQDEEFFEKWGKPKISQSSSEDVSGYLQSVEDGTTFWVSLKIFRPGENDRIQSS